MNRFPPEIAKLVEDATAAFEADDAGRVRALLERAPALKMALDQPIGPFDSPPIMNVRSRAMLDVLLDAGADVNARSQWWAGGFGLTSCVSFFQRPLWVAIEADARFANPLHAAREPVARKPSRRSRRPLAASAGSSPEGLGGSRRRSRRRWERVRTRAGGYRLRVREECTTSARFYGGAVACGTTRCLTQPCPDCKVSPEGCVHLLVQGTPCGGAFDERSSAQSL